MKNKIVKDTLAITVITLVAGLALGIVQDITAEPIARQEALSKERAYKEVFADASSFETVPGRMPGLRHIWMKTDIPRKISMRLCWP